ncbi:hypothetical protein EI94DRAFT_956198 [Lactarius quietus]|nr:hypothetical protein EI94DRAFT_956198 [Lactarius quietus]
MVTPPLQYLYCLFSCVTITLPTTTRPLLPCHRQLHSRISRCSTRTRAQRRGPGARRTFFGIWQALDKVLQPLVLRCVWSVPKDSHRRRRGAHVPADCEACEGGARAAALHLCQRTLNRR